MRIGIDARMLHKAGIRRYTTELIYNLSEIDPDNQYCLYLPPQGEIHDIAPLNANFEPVYLNAPLFSLKEQFLFVSHIKKSKLDLLHTTFDFGAPLWPVKNVVVTVHDVFFGPGTFFRNYKTKMMYQILTRYSVKKSTAIIVVSEFIKKKLLHYIPLNDKKIKNITVIPNGIGSEFKSSAPQEELQYIRKKYGFNRKYLLCVGSFASRIKNLPRILEAYSRLPESILANFQLIIAGEFFSRVPEASAVIKKLEAHNSVLCLGYVPDEDLPALYRHAEVFVFPSLHEGFGIPIVEAMASGTPVITSNTSAMPEIAGNAAIFVDPYNVKEISERMAEILMNENLRDMLTERGFAQAQKYSWHKTAQKTLEVYQSVMRRVPR